jgi:hypothetical protein
MIRQYLPNKTKLVLFIELKKYNLNVAQISGRAATDRSMGLHARTDARRCGAEDPFQVEADAPTPRCLTDYAASLQAEVTCSPFRRGAARRLGGACLWPVGCVRGVVVPPPPMRTWTGIEFRVTYGWTRAGRWP